jgi:hypothetical protein
VNPWAKVLGGLAAVGTLVALLRGDSSPKLSPRQKVVQAARSQLGSNDKAKYWASSLPGQNPAGLDWCGVFALWSLHQAGLALDWTWELGLGFLMTAHHKLPIVSTPQPGDIAYFTKNQHEAVVLSVNTVNRTVELANGNGNGGVVSPSTIPWNSVTAFFSIDPLLGAA